MQRVRGVLVAGGAGARLGAAHGKARVPFAGSTLLARGLATLARVCDEVLVAAPPDRAPSADELRGSPGASGARRVRVVHDVAQDAGPLAGVVAGLAGRGYDAAVVLGVDFPLARAGFLKALLDELARRGGLAVVPAPGGVLQPLVAAYAPGAGEMLAGRFARGERAVTRAVRTLEPAVLTDAEITALAGGLENLLNVNTPEDLARAEDHGRGGHGADERNA